MAAETAGDPMTGLKWTRRTTARIAAELRSLGIEVCPRTVARLLRTMGFALRVNHKKRAGASHPDRDAQFQHIAGLRRRCAAENLPIVSVDTKKKELVGNFKNPGAKWDRTPRLVRDHDFRYRSHPQANAAAVTVFFQTPLRPIHLSSIRNGTALLHRSANLCVPAFEGTASSLVMSKILGRSIT